MHQTRLIFNSLLDFQTYLQNKYGIAFYDNRYDYKLENLHICGVFNEYISFKITFTINSAANTCLKSDDDFSKIVIENDILIINNELALKLPPDGVAKKL